jgi:hypothetical protein
MSAHRQQMDEGADTEMAVSDDDDCAAAAAAATASCPSPSPSAPSSPSRAPRLRLDPVAVRVRVRVRGEGETETAAVAASASASSTEPVHLPSILLPLPNSYEELIDEATRRFRLQHRDERDVRMTRRSTGERSGGRADGLVRDPALTVCLCLPAIFF